MQEHITSNAKGNAGTKGSTGAGSVPLPDWLASAIILLHAASRPHSKHRAKTVGRLREGKVEAFPDFS